MSNNISNPVQHVILNEAQIAIMAIRDALSALKQQEELILTPRLRVILRNWELTHELGNSYSSLVAAQASNGSTATSESATVLLSEPDSLTPKEFRDHAYAGLISEANIIQKGVASVCDNPFTTQVYSMQIPFGAIHSVLHFAFSDASEKYELDSVITLNTSMAVNFSREILDIVASGE